jgi:ribosomal protein S18 acetylase RimI-like enzyme
MSRPTIAEARGADDLAAVRDLCEGFLAWLKERYPAERWMIDRYYAPERWAAMLDGLPREHAPPAGEILLARLDGAPVGCAMLRPLEPGICEMKRLFVRPEARGHAVGRSLCRRLMALAAERGYRLMRLDTAFRHDEALGLYAALGFRRRDAYYDCPEDIRPLLVFMEAELPGGSVPIA